jgi:hypothetical protein
MSEKSAASRTPENVPNANKFEQTPEQQMQKSMGDDAMVSHAQSVWSKDSKIQQFFTQGNSAESSDFGQPTGKEGSIQKFLFPGNNSESIDPSQPWRGDKNHKLQEFLTPNSDGAKGSLNKANKHELPNVIIGPSDTLKEGITEHITPNVKDQGLDKLGKFLKLEPELQRELIKALEGRIGSIEQQLQEMKALLSALESLTKDPDRSMKSHRSREDNFRKEPYLPGHGSRNNINKLEDYNKGIDSGSDSITDSLKNSIKDGLKHNPEDAFKNHFTDKSKNDFGDELKRSLKDGVKNSVKDGLNHSPKSGDRLKEYLDGSTSMPSNSPHMEPVSPDEEQD